MKMGIWRLSACIGATQLLTMIVAAPSDAAASGTDDAPVCLTGRILEGSASGSGFTIVAPRSEVSGLVSRGFVERDCGGLLTELPEFRNQICEYARQAPGELLERFRRTHGISVDEMCSLATRAGGGA